MTNWQTQNSVGTDDLLVVLVYRELKKERMANVSRLQLEIADIDFATPISQDCHKCLIA